MHGQRGSKLDADTVKLNLDRTLELKQGPAYLINNISDVTAADPMTVVITTKAPDPFAPRMIFDRPRGRPARLQN